MLKTCSRNGGNRVKTPKFSKFGIEDKGAWHIFSNESVLISCLANADRDASIFWDVGEYSLNLSQYLE